MLAAGAALALPTGFTDVQVQSPQVTDGEFFGRSVASLGTRLVVGAPGSTHPSFDPLPGRVYVLGIDGIAELVIENPTHTSRDEFGASVAVVGGNIAVGAPFDDTVAASAGAAYVFDGTTGALLHTLLVPGSGSGFDFQCGRVVAALGSDVLVMCGGVYRFDGSTGALVQHYTAPGCLGGRGLATIAGDVLSAGDDGTICRFDGATGAVVQTYVDPEPGLGGLFGSSIGVDGNVVVVGGGVFAVPRVGYVFDGTTGGLEQTIRGPYYVTLCDGSTTGCPADALEPPTTVCRPDAGDCDVAETCTGSGAACPSDALEPDGTTCDDLAACTSGDMCVSGVCNGDSTQCGDGTADTGCNEQCDDGNTTSGDGCSATCRLERCPTTFPVACHAGGSSVSLQKRSPGLWGVNGDRFVWKWKGASALTDFGDPTASASYQLCFYDDLFGTPDLRLDFAIPAGGLCAGKPCWKAKGTSGFGYADPDRTPSGIDTVTIRSKGGKAKIAVSGTGGRLALPPLVGSYDIFPFNFGWAVVMVESDSGQCWVAASGAVKNQRGRFKGTAGGS